MKKLLAILLTLCMVFPWIPAVARAEEVPGEAQTDRIEVPVPEEETDALIPETKFVTETLPFRINPLYEGMITEADLDIPEIPEFDPEQVFTHAETYLSVEEAGAQVRQHMKNRDETFTIYVKYDTSSAQTAGDAVVAEAVEHTGIATEGDYLMWQFAGWGGNYSRSYNSTEQQYEYIFNLTFAYYTTADQEKEMNTAVTNLINSLGVKNKSDYEKIKGVYNWICDNVTYDYANLEDTSYMLKHTAYAALINKTAVCQGYAVLFYRLMLELGVDNRVIAGLAASGEAHGWNIVKLGDYYYSVDSTWDAGMDEYSFFLTSTWNFVGHYRFLDYETWEFHQEYPMAAEDYDPNVTAQIDPYIYMGTCGETAYWMLLRDGTLIVFGEGEIPDSTYDITDLDPQWEYWQEHITGVIVDEGITRIGDYAFYSMPGLTAAAIAPSVTEIGQYAFGNCEALSQALLYDGLVTIGQAAFRNCKALSDVTFPSTLKEIGSSAFKLCESLEAAILPDSMACIEDYTFDGCKALVSVHLPDALTTIGNGAFRDCTALKTVVIPEGVTSIAAHAFSSCGLDSVTLPDGLETLGSSAFNGCKGLKHITLPGSLTVTGEHVFANCDGLESAVISEGITEISLGAFTDCTNLKTVTLPSTLLWIREEAFSYCSSLESLELPESLKGIMGMGFYKCTSLTEIDFPESCATLSKAAFKDCTSLKRVSLSRNMSAINESLFENCPLEEVKFPPNLFTIYEYAFAGAQFTELEIPSVYTIRQNAFCECDKLRSLKLPDSLENLGGFRSCTSLTEVVIPENVTTIGSLAFAYCSSLQSVVIPDSVTRIGSYAFSGCNLTSIIVPASVTNIDMEAFGNCQELQEVWFRGDAPTFGTDVFKNVVANAYYPANKDTWTENKLKNYGGTITWASYQIQCDEHSYETVVTAPTCTEQGYTTHNCTSCGDRYVDAYVDALGHDHVGTVTEPTCETQGYTAYVCARCGDSYVGDYTDPVDHVYEDDYCKWCGQGAQNIRWYSGTTSLNGTIDLNIYVLLSKDLVEADDTYVRFIYGSNIVDVPMSKALPSPTDTAPNRYRFSCPIYAKQLADNVTVKFMKGSQQIGKDLNYSVVKYCVNQIAKVTDPQEVALYKAMLNYGAAAQLMFDHNIENLANASLSEADKLLPDVDASAYKYAISGKEDGIRAKSATLMLEDVVKVRVYFALTGDKSIEDYIFTIDGKEVAVQQNDKGYYVETSGIAAKDLEKMFSVQVGGITVSYGALSYVNSMANGSKELEANISKALFVYWQAAESYLG